MELANPPMITQAMPFLISAPLPEAVLKVEAAFFLHLPRWRWQGVEELTINNEQLIINNVEVFDIYGRKLSPHHLITSSSHQYLAFASRNIFCKNYDRTGRGD